MTELDKQLRNLTVEISCKHCYKTHNVRLTGFGGTYICECGYPIKTADHHKISICRSNYAKVAH